jgi:hypothetical protein
VAIFHPTLSNFRNNLETKIMIATNDYFVLMRKRAKPFTEVPYLGLLALGGNVSGMDQDVAIGDFKIPVLVMGVADAYYPQRLLF